MRAIRSGHPQAKKEILTGDAGLAHALHVDAHGHYFIARSVNFDVLCEPRISKLD